MQSEIPTRKMKQIQTAPFPNFAIRTISNTEWMMLQAHLAATLSEDKAWHIGSHRLFFDPRRFGGGTILHSSMVPLVIAASKSRNTPRMEYCINCLKGFKINDKATREFSLPSGRSICPNCSQMTWPLFPDSIGVCLYKAANNGISLKNTIMYTTELPNLFLIPLLSKLGVQIICYTYPVPGEGRIRSECKKVNIKVTQIPTSAFANPIY
jgi:hypothetical protein